MTVTPPRPRLAAPNASRAVPRAIWSMAFTELWERFSFYGLQGILSFYLLYSLDKGGLDLGASASAGIVGAYGGAVYLAQLVGAWIGDRLVSPKWVVLWGGVIIACGHVLLAAWPGLTGLGVGLVLIILGTGALKTNITSIVGFLLDGQSDAKRDAGFSYFYMAINVGAVVGPLTTGFAQNQWGFHYGFGLAAIGMLAAIVQYALSLKNLPERAGQVNNPLPSGKLVAPIGYTLAALAVIVAGSLAGWLTAENLSSVVTIVALVAAAGYFAVILSSSKVSREEKTRVSAYLPLFLLSGVYFGFLFQKFTAISILITDRVDLDIGGWSFPVAWITTVSPLSAVLITPLVARLWGRLGRRQPGPAAKFAIGLIQIGVAYFFLLVVSTVTGNGTIPLFLILTFMALAGSSEVFVGPIGLALATKIGPAKFRAQMVGLNFLTLALGSSLSGLLGQLFAAIPSSAYFTIVATSAVALGGALLLARKPLNKWLHAGVSAP
ncbi:oligopeptide:H+ symporter [Streptomyces tubbatahanensis]|uniref:Oligopeptide:H+ symporter n=1 Tax=Streptomyces tubbatahanensis TaxID=2923272 RepID=A0ABY3XLM9_9ACTN|nr:oligopeptide:H+ symporter [Streptomyces tubbatahanensis]UNS95315.1 oligopeptide:H+ symporter [Streptomyces tubbatahanensis]